MLNWINISVEGPGPLIESLRLRLEKILPETDTMTLRESEKGNLLFVESLQIDDIISIIERTSGEYPDQDIGIRYAASIPGSYHIITGTYRAGQLQNVCEEVDDFLLKN